MKMTEEMRERERTLNVDWEDEGEGYASMKTYNRNMVSAMLITGIGIGSGGLVYIALPEGHPDIDGDYDELDPDVNGGLTFGSGNVFGWDYSHLENLGSPEEDLKNALEYFKARESE